MDTTTKNPKRMALTMPENLQALVRKYCGDHNVKAHDQSKIICQAVEEFLKARGYSAPEAA